MTLLPAIGAALPSASHLGSATALDGSQGGELLSGQASFRPDEITVDPDDLRELEPPTTPATRARRRDPQELASDGLEQIEG